MRVLLYGLNYAPEPVGIGKYSGELGGWLAKRGHQIRVITAPPYFPQWHAKGNRYRQERLEGAMVWRCPLWVPRRPNGVTRLLHLASFAVSSLPVVLWQWRWKPDLIICVAPTLFCAPGALLLKRMCGPKTLAWLHIQDFELDAAFELGLLKGRWMRVTTERIEQRLLKNFQRVSSISEAMRGRVISKGVRKERTELLPNWVDLSLIYPQAKEERLSNPYRKELGIKCEQLVLLYSGSMNKKQGLEIVVQAVEALGHREDLVWVFGGDGPGKAALINGTKHLAQVLHMGLQPVERLNDWLNLADIHILPQKAAAADLVLPSKVLGILASGRAMVAASPEHTTLGELAEQTGRRVNPGEAIAIEKAIIELAENEQERKMLGERARKIAVGYYCVNSVLTEFERIAQSALEEGRGCTSETRRDCLSS